MKLAQHPNILPLLCSFAEGPKLWMVEPYVSGGSMQNIIKYAYPYGLEEAQVRRLHSYCSSPFPRVLLLGLPV